MITVIVPDSYPPDVSPLRRKPFGFIETCNSLWAFNPKTADAFNVAGSVVRVHPHRESPRSIPGTSGNASAPPLKGLSQRRGDSEEGKNEFGCNEVAGIARSCDSGGICKPVPSEPRVVFDFA